MEKEKDMEKDNGNRQTGTTGRDGVMRHCVFSRQMEYSADDTHSEVLARGSYRNIDFLVLNIGHRHPCGYVDVRNTRLRGMYYDNVNIECHGGLTFSGEFSPLTCEKGWWIGWDYGHCWDYSPRLSVEWAGVEYRQWTTEEVVAECLDVIDQVWAY